MKWIGWVFVVLGLFAILGALFNWEWFFNSRKAQVWVNVFGRNGARIFYLILGLVFAGFGLFYYFSDWNFFLGR